MTRKLVADRFTTIEEHLVAFRDLAMDRARHDIARREFGCRMYSRHESPARLVDQDRTFATQRFGCERSGIAADGDGRGMELDEFGICNQRTGACRHAEPFAARLERIGRNGIERAETACCEDHCRRAKQHELHVGTSAVAREQPHNLAVFHRKFDGMEAFHHLDGRRRENFFRPACA